MRSRFIFTNLDQIRNNWRGGRVVECDALEMRFGATQRGFESPPLRYAYTVSISTNSAIKITG